MSTRRKPYIMAMRAKADFELVTASPTTSHPSAATLLFGASAAQLYCGTGHQASRWPLRDGRRLGYFCICWTGGHLYSADLKKSCMRDKSDSEPECSMVFGFDPSSWHRHLARGRTKKTEGDGVAEHYTGVVSRNRCLNGGLGNGLHLFLP